MPKIVKVTIALGIIGIVAVLSGLGITQYGDYTIGLNIGASGFALVILCGFVLLIEDSIYKLNDKYKNKIKEENK